MESASFIIPLTAKMLSNDNKLIIIAIWAFWRAIAHTNAYSYIQLRSYINTYNAALGHMKSAEKDAYVHAVKKKLLQRL